MIKRSIGLVLALVMVFALVACGGGGGTQTPSGDTGTTGDSGGNDAAPAGEGIKLVYWSMWNATEPQAQALNAAVQDFMSKNSGINVEINWAGREIRQTLLPALDASMQIDIFDEDVQRVNDQWSDYLLDLESYYEKEYPTTDGKPYNEVVMPMLQDLARSYHPTGALCTVGYQPFIFLFLYNKDQFAQAGITSPPATWAEFLDANDKLLAAGIIPTTTDNEFASAFFGYYLCRLKGPTFGDELAKDMALWDDPAVLESLKAIEEMASRGHFDSKAGSNIWPVGQQDMAIGSVSYYFCGTWLVNEVMGTTGPDFPWGQFSFPAVPGGVHGTEGANYGSQVFAINKNCANPEEAFSLLVHFTTGEWDARLAQESFGVPVAGTTDWPAQLADSKSIFAEASLVYPWLAGVENDSDTGPLVRINSQRLIDGLITAEEFIDNIKAGK